MSDESNEPIPIALRINYIGRECYEVNLELKEKIKSMKIGEIAEIKIDSDEASTKMLQWCRQNQQELFFSHSEDGIYYFYIKRLK
ncbi:MAG: sulfurtransferase TusA family protein [Asgard group archaeon]|nr:sulfurtransferase TusA family protein [Asgard group archaeon]